MKNIGRYSKFIAAVLGLVGTILTSYYADAAWMPGAVSAIAAIGVLLVPNKPAAP